MPFTIPGATQLWNGCITATIAHAVFTAHHPELANEQSWDDINYNIQDSAGALGTVTFAPLGIVGAFFDAHSPRNPLSLAAHVYDLSARLAEMPATLHEIAEKETLEYLLQDYEEKETPLITAAFWSKGEDLVAAEPWADVFANGGYLIQTQLKPAAEAIEIWRNHYSLSAAQIELLKSLSLKKINAKNSEIVLSESEKAALLEQGDEGLAESRELLAGIKIVVP